MSLMGFDPVLIGETADHYDPLLDGLRQCGPVLNHFTQPGVCYLRYASRRFYAITARGGGIPREFPLI